MFRRHVPQSWNQLGFVIVACVFFYAAFRVAFPAASIREKATRPLNDEDYALGSASKACSGAAQSGEWLDGASSRCTEGATEFASCDSQSLKVWRWSDQALQCGIRRIYPPDLMPVLKTRWIAVVGDSIGRNLFAALLRLLGGQGKYPIQKAHQDFEYTLPNDVRASFFWAPYSDNLTDLMSTWIKHDRRPDFMILSMGLWHVLHVTSSEEFSRGLKKLGPTLETLAGIPSSASEQNERTRAHMSVCGISEVQPQKLQAEDKRKNMTPARIQAYNQAIMQSGLLMPPGLLRHLDVHSFTSGCGALCSEDGIHYSNATYDTILQTWANTLPLKRL